MAASLKRRAEQSGAMQTALAAHGRIEAHEKVCTERWEQSRATMNEVRADVKVLLSALNREKGALSFGKGAWTIIVALAGGFGWLVHLAMSAAPH